MVQFLKNALPQSNLAKKGVSKITILTFQTIVIAMVKSLKLRRMASIVCLLVFGLVGCNKNTNEKQEVLYSQEELAKMREVLTNELGVSKDEIKETDTSFIIQNGCIHLSKKGLIERYAKPANTAARNFNFGNKVSAKNIGLVISTNVPLAWRTALQTAVSRHNALPASIKFSIPTNFSPVVAIRVNYVYNADKSILAWVNEFPSKNGLPSSSININSNPNISLSSIAKAYCLNHEMLHSISIMHQDSNPKYQFTTGNAACDNNWDFNSIMNPKLPITIPSTTFTSCDVAGLVRLYP